MKMFCFFICRYAGEYVPDGRQFIVVAGNINYETVQVNFFQKWNEIVLHLDQIVRRIRKISFLSKIFHFLVWNNNYLWSCLLSKKFVSLYVIHLHTKMCMLRWACQQMSPLDLKPRSNRIRIYYSDVCFFWWFNCFRE